MAKQSPAKIIRALMTVTGKGKFMFNDKTSFGRSIKVWGMDRKFYNEAAKVLSQHGYKTSIVKTRDLKGLWSTGGQWRIWVYN